MGKDNISNYSLGSLYRVLYSATRLNVIDREVVIFLLASLSFSMPQFVESEKRKIKDSIEKRNEELNKKRETEKVDTEVYNCKRMREAFRYQSFAN